MDISSLLEFEERVFKPFPFIHYNRVEGLFLGGGFKFKPTKVPGLTLSTQGGYGLSNQEWKFKAEISKDFFKINKLTVGAGFFVLTSTLDDWYIGWIENSLSGLFFKEDFMDYYTRKGYMAYFNQDLFDSRIRLRLATANYDYESMSRKTDWALLGKNKSFKENPAVIDGIETSIKLILSYDGRDNPMFPISGWLIDGIYEHTSGDFRTDGMFLNIKRFQPTFGAQRIRVRTMLGTRKGSLANQHLMDLGGLGTLPGFKDKEFQNGNRFLLFNLNYQFNGDLLRKLPLSFIPLYDAFTMSLFLDSGWLSLEDKDTGLFKGFENVQSSRMKTDVGISLSVSEEMLLVKFAKRTDRSNEAWRILARIMYKF